ncbi:hypothetical protein [Nonomuraea guangzhouensis]|uniref:DUF2523 domain-containing protein n=1 Tax=Nonomuraea guangzhouensis TaxID=1291555 RepID=A0ABW4G6U7_9ACTN|nr:hypothetical protein [Nonomuraea guangzhouensis]
MANYLANGGFSDVRYSVSEFLASVLAKAAMMLLQALITRIVQALVTSLIGRAAFSPA